MDYTILERLEIDGFRGWSKQIDFYPGKTIVRGPNKARKSTIFNAFLWLIYGLDAEGRFNYDLFDANKPLTHDNSVPISVYGRFRRGEGLIELRRVAQQKWVRKRAKAEYEKDSTDDYKFFVNGLEVTSTGYKQFITDNFGPLDKLPLMLNVRHYISEDWKKLRLHFAKLVDDVTDADLKGDYSPIMPLLDKYGNAGAKDFVRQQTRPLKEQIDKLHAAVDAKRDMLPDLAPVKDAERAIDDLRVQIAEIDKAIVDEGERVRPYAEKRLAEENAIRQKRSEYDAEAAQWDSQQRQALREAEHVLRKKQIKNEEIAQYNAAIARRKESIKRQLVAMDSDIEFAQQMLTSLRKQAESVCTRQFEQICSQCGQRLPDSMVAESKAKFDADVARESEAISEKGWSMRRQVEERTAAKQELSDQLAEIRNRDAIDLAPYKAAVADAKASIVPFAQTTKAMELKGEIERMTAVLTRIPDKDIEKEESERSRLLTELSEKSKILGLRDAHAKLEAEIQALNETSAEASVSLARWEGELQMLIEREREWASIVRDRANQHLSFCKVEVCEFDKSGNLQDTFSISVDGVDIGTVNTADKVKAGIDIAHAFMARYGVNLPIFVDNAEGITSDNFPAVDGQVIAMFVDETAPGLVFEQG